MQVLSPIEAERRKLQKVEKERVSLVADAMRSHVVEFRKTQLNEFLKSSGLTPVRKVDQGINHASAEGESYEWGGGGGGWGHGITKKHS